MSPSRYPTEPHDRFGLVGCLFEGRVRVGHPVAEGGFGVVYRARHEVLDVDVALKLFKPRHDLSATGRAQLVDAFLREARTLARIQHPGIVRVLDAGVADTPGADGVPWLSLEWLSGETFEAALGRRAGSGGRSPREVLALIRPVLDAMAAVHDARIAHRDIKPANIMLTVGSQGERPCLLDFGICKDMELDAEGMSASSPTRSPIRSYTPAYAAREQVLGMRTGPQTDVHALALIVVELLTDRGPYHREDGPNDLESLTERAIQPVRPTPAVRGVDVGPWEHTLRKALDVDPRARFADARAFREALDQGVGDATSCWEGARIAEQHDAPCAPSTPSGGATTSPTGVPLPTHGRTTLVRRRRWSLAAAAVIVAQCALATATLLRYTERPTGGAPREGLAPAVRTIVDASQPDAGLSPPDVLVTTALTSVDASIDASERHPLRARDPRRAVRRSLPLW